ncbi:unnamed protein product [Knipowitschia caucasica]
MYCSQYSVNLLTYVMLLAAVGQLLLHKVGQTAYGRHMVPLGPTRMVPAKLAWLFLEVPSFLVPLILIMLSHSASSSLGQTLLLGTFCLHYFQRSFVYSFFTKGRPCPVGMVMVSGLFSSLNGFLQGHYLLHCAQFGEEWTSNVYFKTGLVLFYIGLAVNVHSDNILRNLRKPGEVVYRIPRGGLFEYVSGANYFGEILEWFGCALATWSLPMLSFALFSLCFLGTRAYYHHRFYQEKFNDYPMSRKALIPFIF